MGKKIELFGHENCPSCLIVKKYFEENNIEFDYIDIFEDQTYAVDCGVRGVPHLIIDKTPYVNPSLTQIKNILGL